MFSSITTTALDTKQEPPKQDRDSSAPINNDDKDLKYTEEGNYVKEESASLNPENNMRQEEKNEEAEIEDLSKSTIPATTGN